MGEFAGTQADLEHGDLFCTRDKAYQRFRRWFRNFPWAFFEPFFTANFAHRTARFVRGQSKGEEARGDPEFYGIQPEPVQRTVSRGAKVIVAGHVHTPFSRDYVGGDHTGRLHVMSD